MPLIPSTQPPYYTTQDTPTLKRYTALLEQGDSTAPIATILENTLSGTPVWTRTSVGDFTLTLADEFGNTTTCFIQVDDLVFNASWTLVSENAIRLRTYDELWSPMEDFNKLCIQISVYS